MPCLSYLALPFVARFLCGGRRGTFAYRVGQLVIALLGFACLAASLYLFQAGEKARWTSDGPGMLFVILFIFGFGFLGLLFGAMLIGTWTRDDPDEEDRFASARTAIAALILLAVVAQLAWLAWRYWG